MTGDADDPKKPTEESNLDLPPAFAEMIGEVLGDYHLDRVVGHGSMGVVFEARHQKLGRRVALKVLPPGLGATEKAIRRFLREARAVARLDHENIVDIYEIGESGTTHFYAMQFLDGKPLDRVLRRHGPMHPVDAAKAVGTAARAIHFAHQRGIIHRDLKPANLIKTEEGKVIVTDFGLARPERAASLTDSGAMVGTPLYMSPEQVRGERDQVDRSSDVYSLGATLYELITGEPPFSGNSTQEILQKILDEEPRPMRSLAPGVPSELEIITMKALEKRPQHRYSSALELAQDLERYLEGEPILARRASLITKALKRVRKHRTITVLSLVVAVVTLSLVAMFASERRDQRTREFQTAVSEGRRAFRDKIFESALGHFEEALTLRPADLDAQIEHAWAMQELATKWDELLAGREVGRPSPDWEHRYESPEKMVQQALEEARSVLRQRPDDPLANLVEGRLLLSMADKERDPNAKSLLYNQALGHVARAEELCHSSTAPEVWWTQYAIAEALYTVADAPGRDPGQMHQLLQRALTQSSGAIGRHNELAREQGEDDDRTQEGRSRQYLQRSQIFRKLFEASVVEFQSGESRRNYQYLEHCEADALEADRLWPSRDAKTVLAWVDDKRPVQRGPALSRDRAQPDEAAFTFLISPKSSERSRALEDLMDSFVDGGAFLTGIGGEVVNAMLDRGSHLTPVSHENRQQAIVLFGQAQKILAPAKMDIAVQAFMLEVARDNLDQAICLDPNSAEYHSEFAFACQLLGDWPLVLAHSQKAVDLAPTDPTFLEAHARRLLAAAEAIGNGEFDRQELLEQAAETARTLVKLYGKDKFQPLLDLAQSML